MTTASAANHRKSLPIIVTVRITGRIVISAVIGVQNTGSLAESSGRYAHVVTNGGEGRRGSSCPRTRQRGAPYSIARNSFD